MRKLFLLTILLILAWACNKKADVSITEISKNWQFRKVGDSVWLPATVPGCVHTDLLANKIIEDPFYRDNESKLQWIDKTDWDYRTTFNISPEAMRSQTIELDFKGLDTYADVFVNDSLVLSTDNMFREWIVPVTFRVKEGQNSLRVLFKSPINEGIKKYDAYNLPLPAANDYSEIGQVPGYKKVSIFTRKAPYNYGWDWGPRLLTSGVWRPVYIRTYNKAIINDLQIVQDSVSKTIAQLTAKVEIQALDTQTIAIELTDKVNAGINVKEVFKLEKGVNIVSLSFDVQNPKLWWSRGLGEAYMYKFETKVSNASQLIDKKEVNTGIRTLKLIQNPDTFGHSFYFELNGVPVFAKGSNYIPNDVFIPRVTPQTYEHIVKSAADANMNMLRLWGGGFYENDIFYDLCDKYGIMIWHDFMFACSMYPVDSAFLENVKVEVVQNIKRVRNHPSIAVWCGNNEISTAWQWWGWQDKYTPEQRAKIYSGYELLFHNLLPKLVKQYDPQRQYHPSSPFAGVAVVKNDTVSVASFPNKSGDMHEWAVWHGKLKFSYYNDNTPRFCSEYGFQSFPDMNTIKSFARPNDYDINSPVMKLHQRSGPGNLLIKTYMDYDYKAPKDFESFIYASQVLQADGVKQAIEAHRRHMPFCMGTLFWQINDCWQAPSWSSIDYLGHWKALQYQAKRSYSDVLVSPVIEKGKLNVYAISDKINSIKPELNVSIIDFDGKKLWEFNKDVILVHNDSKIEYSAEMNQIAKQFDTTNVLLVATLKLNNQIVSLNTLTLSAPKYLNFPKANITKKVSTSGNKYIITLKSDKLAKNVYLSCVSEGFFSDNFFDLLPNESVSIEFTPKGNAKNFEKELSIISLVDSY